ncbi:MAG: ATP-binding protein [Mariprofundaceae bacterium]
MQKNKTSALSCTLNSQCDCINVLRSIVEVVASRAKLDPIEVNRMVLAVDELFANISEHGYGDKPGIIEMSAAMEQTKLCFEFRDFASPIRDKNCLQGRDLDDIRPGGLGLHLISSVMDETFHEALNDGNRWVLTRYLSVKEHDLA